MAMLTYKALDSRDHFVSGEIDAPSVAAATERLQRDGLMVLAVEAPATPAGGSGLSFGGAISARDLTGTLHDLALLLRAGLVLTEALLLLADGAPRTVARFLGLLRRRIMEGASLSDALERHLPKPDPGLVALVRIAELAGTLGEVLTAVSEERAADEAMADRLAAALRYPAVLLLASVGILVFFLAVIVPQFAQVVRDFKTTTDGLIGVVFAASDLMVTRGDLLAGGALAILCLLVGLLRWEATRAPLTRAAVRLPGIRGLVELRRTVWFCSNLGLLVGNGVTLANALKVLADSAGPDAAELRLIYEGVRQGGRLGDALARPPCITPLAARMLKVGEEAGEFAAVARRTGLFTQTKLAQRVERLTAIVGPVAIIGISTLVGGLIISIMTTLLSLNQVAL